MCDVRFGLVTVSDTCAADSSRDGTGKKAMELIRAAGHAVARTTIVEDDKTTLHNLLLDWIKLDSLDVILTLGGTGLTPRDITTDTLLDIIAPERRLPGMEHALYTESLKHTPYAMLSRFVVGVQDKVIIIALPGNIRAAEQCIPVLLQSIPHAVHQVHNLLNLVKKEHGTKSTPVDCLLTQLNVTERPRQSAYPMIAVEQAVTMVLTVADTLLTTLSVEAVPYSRAHGHVLGVSLYSQQDIPPYDASVMDGYAVLFADGSGPRRVVGALCAGDDASSVVDGCLQQGTCMRVNTGGPVPKGADAVVAVEKTELLEKQPEGEEESLIRIQVAPSEVGQFIRTRGFDLKTDSVFQRGLLLGPPELGLLAGAGLLAPWPDVNWERLLVDKPVPDIPLTALKRLQLGGHLPCVTQPHIGLMSTGNELLDFVKSDPSGSSVRDSNRLVLLSLLQRHNFTNVSDFGIVVDELSALGNTLERALQECDVVITTGGVSMGEHDLVAYVLEKKFSATVHFARVYMKPGKPTTVLTVSRPDGHTVVIFCLPGNPVSTFVTAHLFVLPFLRKLELRPPTELSFKRIFVRLSHAVTLGDRPDYRRARLVWESPETDASENVSLPSAVCDHVGIQMSSRLASCFDSNLLLLLPPATKNCQRLEKNVVVEAMIIGTLM